MRSKTLSAAKVEKKMTPQEQAGFHLRKCGQPFGAWHKKRKPLKPRKPGFVGGVSFSGECCTLPKLDEPPSLAWRAAANWPRPCIECGTGHKGGNAFCSANCHRDWKANQAGRG